MSTTLPSKQRRSFLRATSVLRTVIDSQGGEVLTGLLRDRTTDSSLRPGFSPIDWKSMSALVSQVRTQTLEQTAQSALANTRSLSARLATEAGKVPPRFRAVLARTKTDLDQLPTRLLRAQYLALRAARPFSWLSGFILGVQLPALDFRFKRGASAVDAITLHSVPMMGVDVSLEWIRRVLNITISAPDLDPSDRKLLQALEVAVGDYQNGAWSGSGTRQAIRSVRKVGHPQQSLPLTAQSFQIIETVLNELAAGTRKRS